MSFPEASPRTSRLVFAALGSVIPFAAAMVALNLWVALLGPAIAAAAIRYVGSWRAWAWVAAALAIASTGWGWYVWAWSNAHCVDASPLVPALQIGVSVLVGAAVGAAVVGPAGAAWRAAAGAVIGAVATLALVVATTFLLVGLGMPAFLSSVSHC